MQFVYSISLEIGKTLNVFGGHSLRSRPLLSSLIAQRHALTCLVVKACLKARKCGRRNLEGGGDSDLCEIWFSYVFVLNHEWGVAKASSNCKWFKRIQTWFQRHNYSVPLKDYFVGRAVEVTCKQAKWRTCSMAIEHAFCRSAVQRVVWQNNTVYGIWQSNMFYGRRSCVISIKHVLWPKNMICGHKCMFYAHRTCSMAIEHVMRPKNMIGDQRIWSMAIERVLLP